MPTSVLGAAANTAVAARGYGGGAAIGFSGTAAAAADDVGFAASAAGGGAVAGAGDLTCHTVLAGAAYRLAGAAGPALATDIMAAVDTGAAALAAAGAGAAGENMKEIGRPTPDSDPPLQGFGKPFVPTPRRGLKNDIQRAYGDSRDAKARHDE